MRLPITGRHGNNRVTEKYQEAEIVAVLLKIQWGTAKELYQALYDRNYAWDVASQQWLVGQGRQGVKPTPKYVAAKEIGLRLGLVWHTAFDLYLQLEVKNYEYDEDSMWLEMCD